MMRSWMKLFLGTMVLFLLPVLVSAQTYVFAQLTGAPLNTNGWNLQGAAKKANITSNDFSELLLCAATNSSSGAIFYNQPINLSLCSKWTAEFDMRMFDGTGADGIAFCFLDVPPSGYVIGGGLGIPGTANGLKICFDTWNNCLQYPQNHDLVPKIEIRWGIGYAGLNGEPGECLLQPTKDNADNSLSFLRSNTYNHVKVSYDAGNISVSVNDQLYLTGFQQFNFKGYLGFTASTGGSNDNHSIKNVIIYTDMPPSVAAATDSLSGCGGTQFQLGTTANPDYAYQWLPVDGLTSTNSSNPIVTVQNDGLTPAYYTYYVNTSFATKPGCASTDSVVIKVQPSPKVNFINPEICLNDAIAHFKDSSYTGDITQYPFTYNWNFGDANAGTGNANSSVLQNPDHSYSAQGNYTVGLTVTSAYGCKDSTSKIFTVNGAVPNAAFQVQNASLLCSNQLVAIKNNATVDFGNITKVVIFWDDTGNTADSTIDESPLPGKLYHHAYTNFQQPLSKQYTIRYIAYSGITCFDEAVENITIHASPAVVFSEIPGICYDTLPRQITQAFAQPGNAGNFMYSGTGVSASGLFSSKQSGVGSFPITYSFTTLDGCVDSATQTIIVYPNPVISAGPDITILVGGRVTIPATASGESLQYKWLPYQFMDDNTLLQPTVNPVADTRYFFTAMGIGNCSSHDTILVKVLPNPVVPNAFSPNGDGINDTWLIRYLDLYPACTVSVFNRYGQPVFHSDGYNTPWNGRYKGQPVPVGTYYYIIDRKNIGKLISGSLTLLR